jgi:ABC-type multidrug transport system ATPase subunit
MLTGQLTPSSGICHILGCNSTTQLEKVLIQVGFCPQFDTLFDHFTARETVRIYADIKGTPLDEVDRITNSLFDALKLTPFADKLVR